MAGSLSTGAGGSISSGSCSGSCLGAGGGLHDTRRCNIECGGNTAGMFVDCNPGVRGATYPAGSMLILWQHCQLPRQPARLVPLLHSCQCSPMPYAVHKPASTAVHSHERRGYKLLPSWRQRRHWQQLRRRQLHCIRQVRLHKGWQCGCCWRCRCLRQRHELRFELLPPADASINETQWLYNCSGTPPTWGGQVAATRMIHTCDCLAAGRWQGTQPSNLGARMLVWCSHAACKHSMPAACRATSTAPCNCTDTACCGLPELAGVPSVQ